MTKTDPSKVKKNLLTEGQILNNQWFIEEKIGGGGFGEVYRALLLTKSNTAKAVLQKPALPPPALRKYVSADSLTSSSYSDGHLDSRETYVAVKVEAAKSQKLTLAIEVAVLRALVGSPNVCQLVATGKTSKVAFIVMTLQGPSLSALFKKSPQRRITLSTTLRLACKCLDAIEAVHSVGYLHRDIKPGNFTLRTDDPHEVCILDFGLSRKFLSSDPRQTIREPRSEVSFRGTVRYASINAHEGRELGRHDDIWSLLYMLIEFISSTLPWNKITDKREVAEQKRRFDLRGHAISAGMPAAIVNRWTSHLDSLDYFTAPDYSCLKAVILEWMKLQEVSWNDPYDWERNYSSLYSKNSSGSRSASNRFKSKRVTDNDDTRAECPTRLSKTGDQTTMAVSMPTDRVNQNGDKTLGDEAEFDKFGLANERVYKRSLTMDNGVNRQSSFNSLPLLPPCAPLKQLPASPVSRKISFKNIRSKLQEGHSRREAVKEAAK
uniref:non-specific serine/threonine protein kinase n=1 Tax=Schistocephalus solidus TaxID=70667 RepID=A0A0V0J7I9_SCHSO